MGRANTTVSIGLCKEGSSHCTRYIDAFTRCCESSGGDGGLWRGTQLTRVTSASCRSASVPPAAVTLRNPLSSNGASPLAQAGAYTLAPPILPGLSLDAGL